MVPLPHGWERCLHSAEGIVSMDSNVFNVIFPLHNHMLNHFAVQGKNKPKSKKSGSFGPTPKPKVKPKAKADPKPKQGRVGRGRGANPAGAASKRAKKTVQVAEEVQAPTTAAEAPTNDADGKLKGKKTAQAIQDDSADLCATTSLGRQKYWLDDAVSASLDAAQGQDVQDHFGDETSHSMMAMSLRFMLHTNLPKALLGTGTDGITNRWARTRESLVAWGMRKHKAKLAGLSEEDLVNSLSIKQTSQQPQSIWGREANEVISSFFTASEDVEALQTFMQENDIEDLPLSMLPIVSSVQHKLLTEMLRKHKAGEPIDFDRVLGSIAQNLFAALPPSWLRFAAAAIHLVNTDQHGVPENAKTFFPTESVLHSFLSLRTSVTTHLLVQLSAASMQAKVGTSVSEKRFSFNVEKTSGLVALDAACAAYATESPMSQWLQSWSHALTRLQEDGFQDEMRSMSDLMKTSFEQRYKDEHPELVVPDMAVVPEEPPVQEGGNDDGNTKESFEEWVDLSRIIDSLWEPPEGADAEMEADEEQDMDDTFGPMQHSDKKLSSAQIRMFAASAEHAMQNQMLCQVPGIDKGYSRVAPMG